MDRRVIALGIIIAGLSYAASLGLSEVHDYVGEILYQKINGYSAPFFGGLKLLINCLYWFIPGFFIGFTAKSKPVKSATLVGFIAGILVALAGMAINNSQSHDISLIYANLFFYITFTAKLSFLFALAASFGYVVSEHRKALTSGSSRSLRSLGTG